MLDKDDPWLRTVSDGDVVDPLTPVARSERNALLISNLFVFAVFQVHIVPTKISFAGTETNQFDAEAIKLLALVVLIYFSCSFASSMEAEYRSWKSSLESLRERRQLRAQFYFEKTLEKAASLERELMGDSADLGLIAAKENQIANFNDMQQREWREYRRGYERRMMFDGYVPLLMSVVNAFAALAWYVVSQ